MSFNGAGKMRTTRVHHTEWTITPEGAETLRESWAGFPAPKITPRMPPIKHRPGTIECVGCGALVHPSEACCSYCLRQPAASSPAAVEPDRLDVTCLDDDSPQYVEAWPTIPQPTRGVR